MGFEQIILRSCSQLALTTIAVVFLASSVVLHAQETAGVSPGPESVSVQIPLGFAPNDTSSPRSTLKSFIDAAEELDRMLADYLDSPSRAKWNRWSQASRRAARLLDLSQVPPAIRRKVGAETWMLLWEILARLKLPPFEAIPDAAAYQNDDEAALALARWRIPGTEISIARVKEGPFAGEFLFSPDTVRRAHLFYERVRTFPYRRPLLVEHPREHQLNFTGWMIPRAWVEALPQWSRLPFLELTPWKWFVLVLLYASAIAAVVAVHRRVRCRPWDGSLSCYLRHLTTPVVILVLAQLLEYLTEEQLQVRGTPSFVASLFVELTYYVSAAWATWLTANRGAEAIIASPKINPKGLQAHLLRLAARVIGIVVSLGLLLHAAHQVGIPVYGLVAGVGVTSLALALAARNTVENFIGSLNLYADRPVRVGDFCRYGEDPSPGWLRIGTVESIGARSTKLRGIDRTITTIPNAEFSQMHIINLTARDRMLFMKTLTLRYETTEEQLRLALVKLRELLLGHPRVTEDPARVRFSGFSEFALNVDIFAYINTADWNEFLAIQEDLCLRIMRVIREAGTGFALPSRTVYTTRDGGLDAEQQDSAAHQVKAWMAAQNLPFPEFTREHRAALWNTLDYPPEGSPDTRIHWPHLDKETSQSPD